MNKPPLDPPSTTVSPSRVGQIAPCRSLPFLAPDAWPISFPTLRVVEGGLHAATMAAEVPQEVVNAIHPPRAPKAQPSAWRSAPAAQPPGGR